MTNTSRSYPEENNETEYSVENFNGPVTRHEYLNSEGILNLEDETYRIRVNEQDDHLYIDVWQGEYDGRNFENIQYMNHTRTDLDNEMPTNLNQVDEILSNQESSEVDSIVEFVEQGS